VAKQQEYALPDDTLILKFVQFKDQGQQSYFLMKALSIVEFNRFVDGWDGTTFHSGTPTTYTVYAGNLLLFPIPDFSVTDAIKIYYTRKPTNVVLTTDTPDLPSLYHKALEEHCVYEAYELDENWEAAQVKLQKRDNDVALLRGRIDWKQQEVYPTISVLPEDEW